MAASAPTNRNAAHILFLVIDLRKQVNAPKPSEAEAFWSLFGCKVRNLFSPRGLFFPVAT